MVAYTLDQACRDIADLRGVIAHLLANMEVTNLKADGTFTAPDGSVWSTSGLLLKSPGGMTGGPCLAQTDTSTGTSAGTGLANLTKIWSVPANDPTLTSGYRLTSGGTFSLGGTAQILTVCLNTFSNSTAIVLPIGGAEFAINTSFWWRAQGEVTWSAVGASGTFIGGLKVDIGVSGGNQATVAGTGQTAGGFAAYGTAASINTTSSSSIALQAKWGATVGSPTISGKYSTFERIGL
jgi:hypothetical protein